VYTARERAALTALLCAATLGLAGCTPLAGATPTPTPTRLPPTAAPTPTKQVAFVVQVTSVPGTHKRRHRPSPTPTPFAAHGRPYIALIPASGPPVSRMVRLVGGNLPKRVPVDMLWSARGHSSPMDTVIYTGPRGNIDVSYTVPMSAPGSYSLVAQINGVTYASARYQVASHASLNVTVTPQGGKDNLVVTGRHFIANFKLALVAYHTDGNQKPLVLGMIRASSHGRFVFHTTTTKLAPGQYILRSWAVSDLAAQMAETVFEVEL
jgi:hypothetical protein